MIEETVPEHGLACCSKTASGTTKAQTWPRKIQRDKVASLPPVESLDNLVDVRRRGLTGVILAQVERGFAFYRLIVGQIGGQVLPWPEGVKRSYQNHRIWEKSSFQLPQ